MIPMIEPKAFLDMTKGLAAAQVVQATDCTLDQALAVVERQVEGMGRETVSPRNTAEMVLMCIREIEESR